MNDQTKQFLTECKKAGYEFVTIYIQDKRVPITMQIEKYGEQKYHTLSGGLVAPSAGEYWGETWREDVNGDKIITNTCKVVAAAPERRESGRPALWTICEQLPITAGLNFRGTGFGESHDVHRGMLDKGFYYLKEFAA